MKDDLEKRRVVIMPEVCHKRCEIELRVVDRERLVEADRLMRKEHQLRNEAQHKQKDGEPRKGLCLPAEGICCVAHTLKLGKILNTFMIVGTGDFSTQRL